MQYRVLGRTGREVSVIGFGGIKLPHVEAEEATGALNRALDLGIATAKALVHLYPSSYQTKHLDKLLLHPPTATAIKENTPTSIIRQRWNRDLKAFNKRKKRYQLYR